MDFYGKTPTASGNSADPWEIVGYVYNNGNGQEGIGEVMDGRTSSTPQMGVIDDGTTSTQFYGGVQSPGTFYIYTVYWDTSSDVQFSANYGVVYDDSAGGTPFATQQQNIGLTVQDAGGAAGHAAGPFYWIRIRSYPPSGVMPSQSFGDVIT